MGCIAVPYLLLLVAPLAYAFANLRRAFIHTAREVKRLDAISRSPLFAEVSASLVGAKTIRAFHAAPFMERKFVRLLDENGRANYLFLLLNRWLGFRLDGLSLAFLAVLAVLSVRAVTPFYMHDHGVGEGTKQIRSWMRTHLPTNRHQPTNQSQVVLRSSLDTGLLALSLTYSLSLTGMIQWAVRQVRRALALASRPYHTPPPHTLTHSYTPHHHSFHPPPHAVRPGRDLPDLRRAAPPLQHPSLRGRGLQPVLPPPTGLAWPRGDSGAGPARPVPS